MALPFHVMNPLRRKTHLLISSPLRAPAPLWRTHTRRAVVILRSALHSFPTSLLPSDTSCPFPTSPRFAEHPTLRKTIHQTRLRLCCTEEQSEAGRTLNFHLYSLISWRRRSPLAHSERNRVGRGRRSRNRDSGMKGRIGGGKRGWRGQQHNAAPFRSRPSKSFAHEPLPS